MLSVQRRHKEPLSISPRYKNRLSQHLLDVYRETFKVFDKDNDGRITVEELHRVFVELHIRVSRKELEKYVQSTKNGFLTFDDFISLFLQNEIQEDEKKKGDIAQITPTASKRELYEVFRIFDLDKNGYVSIGEFKVVMNRLGMNHLTDEEIKFLFQEVGDDNSGELNFTAFCKLMSKV
jgi:calmodulin